MDPKASIWSGRESFLAVIVGQASIILPLFRPRFWGRETWCGGGRPSKRSGAAESLASTGMVTLHTSGQKPSPLRAGNRRFPAGGAG